MDRLPDKIHKRISDRILTWRQIPALLAVKSFREKLL